MFLKLMVTKALFEMTWGEVLESRIQNPESGSVMRLNLAQGKEISKLDIVQKVFIYLKRVYVLGKLSSR